MSSVPPTEKKNTSILAIPTGSILPDVPVEFSIYYKNKNNQFKLLFNTGSLFTHKIKSQLEEKGIQKLYIRQSDKPTYITYLNRSKNSVTPKEPEHPKVTRVGEVIVPPKPKEAAVGFIQKKTEGMEEIPADKITSDTVVEFALYYRGSDNSIKKLIEKGNPFTQSMHDLLEKKGISRLFIKKEDKESFKHYVQSNTPPFVLDEALSLKEKSHTIYRHTSDILENLFKDPRCSWSYARAKSLVEYTVNVVRSDVGAIKAFTDAGTLDYNTHTHSLDVAVFAIGFGQHLGFDRNDMVRIGYAGLFHDIGKSQIDPDILNKEGPLDDEEYEIVKKHSLYSNFILRSHVERDKDVLDGVKYHHEHFDGTGYPEHLKGKDIPLFAQIVSIADVYDAISSKKSYRDAYNSFDALNLMKTDMGSHFDKRLLMEFIKFMGPQY